MNQILSRVSKNVEARCRDQLPNIDLRRALANAVARHVGDDAASLRSTDSERVRMSKTFLHRVDYVAQTIAWMERTDAQVGEQATLIAGKTLRALGSARANFNSIEGLSREFRAFKRAHERRRAQARPRAKRSAVELDDGWRAVRLVSEKELAAAGRSFQNCLAGHDWSKKHSKWLRDGTYEYWQLIDDSEDVACLLQIDPFTDTVDEAKGPRNRTPFQCREALLQFMAKRGLTTCGNDLSAIGICDELIAAAASGDLQTFDWEFGDVAWKLHVGPKLLVGHGPNASFTLRGEVPDEDSTFAACGLDGGWLQTTLRIALRRACRRDADLVAALVMAFRAVEPVLIDDWFGLESAGGSYGCGEMRQ